MPSPFDDFALPADKPARFFPLRPDTAKRITLRPAEEGAPERACWIDLLGWHSEAAQAYRFAREEKLRSMGRDFTPAEAYADLAEMLASLTVAWDLIAPTGRALEVACNFDSARRLYGDLNQRWLRQQAVDFLNNESNFVPDTWKA